MNKKKKNVHVHILIYNVYVGFFIYISTKQKKSQHSILK